MYFKNSPEISFRKARYYFDEVGKNINTFDIVSKMYHNVYQRRKIKRFVLPVGEFNED